MNQPASGSSATEVKRWLRQWRDPSDAPALIPAPRASGRPASAQSVAANRAGREQDDEGAARTRCRLAEPKTRIPEKMTQAGEQVVPEGCHHSAEQEPERQAGEHGRQRVVGRLARGDGAIQATNSRLATDRNRPVARCRIDSTIV